jgi:hypothetical protein
LRSLPLARLFYVEHQEAFCMNKSLFFKIICVVIGLFFSVRVWQAVQNGHVSFGRRFARAVIYATQNPAGFWMGVAFYAAIAAFFFYAAFARNKND